MKNRKILTSLSMVALASVTAVGVGGCSHVGRFVSNSLYSDLESPRRNEYPPVTSFFPGSASVQSILGGKGEGVSCSIPPLSLPFFQSIGADDSPVGLQFRQACAFHDMCYRHGAATYGYDQKDCDFLLQEHSFRICQQIYRLNQRSKNPMDVIEECQDNARRVLLGVRIGGSGAFQAGPSSTYFEFDPLPRDADDFVISRVVRESQELGQDSPLSLVSLAFKNGSTKAIRRTIRLDGSVSRPLTNAMPIHSLNDRVHSPPILAQINEREGFLHYSRTDYYFTGVQPIWIEPPYSTASQYTWRKFDWDAQYYGILPQDSHPLTLVGYSARDSRAYTKSTKEKDRRHIDIHRTRDIYRTLAHAPLLGSFSSSTPQMLVLSRGSNDGAGYKNALEIEVVELLPEDHKDDEGHPMGARLETGSLRMPVNENEEPLAPISIGNRRDGLISATKARKDKDTVELRIHHLGRADFDSPAPHLPDLELTTIQSRDDLDRTLVGSSENPQNRFGSSNKKPERTHEYDLRSWTSRPLSVPSSWLQMPAQAVRNGSSLSSTLVLTKVCVRPRSSSELPARALDEQGCIRREELNKSDMLDAADLISLQVLYVDVSAPTSANNGWPAFLQSSHFSADAKEQIISVNEEVQSVISGDSQNPRKSLKEQINLLFGRGSGAPSTCGARTDVQGENTQHVCSMVRREVIHRWLRSQAIPFFISPTEPSEHRPDVIFVFSGYPGASRTVMGGSRAQSAATHAPAHTQLTDTRPAAIALTHAQRRGADGGHPED